jgi:hypothetical protein
MNINPPYGTLGCVHIEYDTRLDMTYSLGDSGEETMEDTS